MIPLDWSANPAVVPTPKPVLVVSIQDVDYNWKYIHSECEFGWDTTIQPRNAKHFDCIPHELIAHLICEGYKVAIELYEVPNE